MEQQVQYKYAGGKDKVSYKVLIVGDMYVGKTSTLCRFCDGVFPKEAMNITGFSFKNKTLDLHTEQVKLNIWDTVGQERYKTMTDGFYRGARGAIFMYDVTDMDTFHSLSGWIENMEEAVQKTNVKIAKLIAGNKIDCVYTRRVQAERGQAFAANMNAGFIEVSAKENSNVDKMFHMLLQRMKKVTRHYVPEVIPPVIVRPQSKPRETKVMEADCGC